MSTDFKEQILAAVPIEAYIGRVTTLKKKGRYHSGLCPFHKEKTPSFTVTPEKGLYHCFGCGRGGDLFRFVMDHENVPFPEAMEILARFAGIEKPKTRGGQGNDRRTKLVELNAEVMRAFKEMLGAREGDPTRAYLKERGISEEIIEAFDIGYAPVGRDFLAGRFTSRLGELRELGLLRQSEDGRQYEFFRDRLMFPIRDARGGVVAFGGRILPGSNHPAKYINSSDSPVFHKSSVLYGLYTGLSQIRSQQECFVVEGYLDVIGLYQGGIKNAAAPMGTALTPEHLKLLRRYARKVVLLLDGDRAGRAAALKSARLIVDHGDMEADLILLSNGFDPFDVVRSCSPGQLEKVLGSRISAERFLLLETLYPDHFLQLEEERAATEHAEEPLDRLLGAMERQLAYYGAERPDLYPSATDQKKAALRRLFVFLGEIGQATAREFFLSDAARALSISSDALREEWRLNQPARSAVQSGRPTGPAPIAAPASPRSPGVASQARPPAASRAAAEFRRCEESLVLEFAYAPGIAADYLDIMQDFPFQDEGAETFWRYMEDRVLRGEIWTGDTLNLADLPEETFAQFREGFTRKAEEVAIREGVEGAGPEAAVAELLRDHQIRRLQGRLETLDRERAVAGPLEREQLQKDQFVILGEIRELKNLQRGVRKPDKIDKVPEQGIGAFLKNEASGAGETF